MKILTAFPPESKKVLLLLIPVFLHYQLTCVRANIKEPQPETIIYPVNDSDKLKPARSLQFFGFTGLYFSEYQAPSHALDLQGKHWFAEFNVKPDQNQSINVRWGIEKLAGVYAKKNSGVTWSRFSVSYRYWLSKKWALQPAYRFDSNLDPLQEKISNQIAANGLLLSTVVRPVTSSFFTFGGSIAKLSAYQNAFEYFFFGEVMHYLRAYDWYRLRAYVQTNYIFKSRSVLGLFLYNFQFPTKVRQLFYKLGIGLGTDFYENGNKVRTYILLNEIKFHLTKNASLAIYYEKTQVRYSKNQFGIQLAYNLTIPKQNYRGS